MLSIREIVIVSGIRIITVSKLLISAEKNTERVHITDINARGLPLVILIASTPRN